MYAKKLPKDDFCCQLEIKIAICNIDDAIPKNYKCIRFKSIHGPEYRYENYVYTLVISKRKLMVSRGYKLIYI